MRKVTFVSQREYEVKVAGFIVEMWYELNVSGG